MDCQGDAYAAALYEVRPSDDLERQHFSHDKATSELGYHPRDMQATIRDTVRWLQGQKVPLEMA